MVPSALPLQTFVIPLCRYLPLLPNDPFAGAFFSDTSIAVRDSGKALLPVPCSESTQSNQKHQPIHFSTVQLWVAGCCQEVLCDVLWMWAKNVCSFVDVERLLHVLSSQHFADCCSDAAFFHPGSSDTAVCIQVSLWEIQQTNTSQCPQPYSAVILGWEYACTNNINSKC